LGIHPTLAKEEAYKYNRESKGTRFKEQRNPKYHGQRLSRANLPPQKCPQQLKKTRN
jgi:hypothetical protein